MEKSQSRPQALSIIILVFGCVFALVLLVYGRTLGFAFLSWDDDQNVFANPWLNSAHALKFWTQSYNGLYIPLAYSLWAVVRSLSDQPLLFHAVNSVLHAVNSGLVALLFLELKAKPAEGSAGTKDLMLPAACGLLFGLHPLQSETVAWVSGFRDLSASFFALVAILAFLRASSRWSGAYATAFLAFICSVLCKPGTVVLPAALVLVGMLKGTRSFRALLLDAAVWLAAASPMVYLTQRAQAETIPAELRAIWTPDRIWLALDALGFYTTKIFWPQNLAVDYGRLPAAVLQAHSLTLPALALGFALALGVLLWRRGLELASLGWVLALLFLAPVLGLMPFAFQRVSTVSDRYMYLPMLGVALALASLVAKLPRKIVAPVCLAVLLAAGGATLNRIGIWREDASFFQAMYAANPASFSANIGLGNLALSRGDYPQALNSFDTALEVQPTNVLALANAGLALDRLGRYQEVMTRIAPQLPSEKVIASHPLSAKGVARMLAVIGFAQSNLPGSAAAALASYCRAKSLDPSSSDSDGNIAVLAARLKGPTAGPTASESCRSTAD